MARNRQRAKARKQKLHRENVPGSLDHASGEVEEVEAAIVAGADGEPAEPDAAKPDAAKPKPKPAAEPEPELAAADEPDEADFDDDADSIDDEQLGKGAGDVATRPARKRSGPRLVNFIRACWAELQRVDWPDRRQVGQATAVVLGFVVVAGAYLGLADVVAQKLVDLII